MNDTEPSPFLKSFQFYISSRRRLLEVVSPESDVCGKTFNSNRTARRGDYDFSE